MGYAALVGAGAHREPGPRGASAPHSKQTPHPKPGSDTIGNRTWDAERLRLKIVRLGAADRSPGYFVGAGWPIR